MTEAINPDVLKFLQQRQQPIYPQSVVQQGEWSHWVVLRADDNVVWLLFEGKDVSVNAINEPVLMELKAILEMLQSELPTALVLSSAKSSGFCAGADIGMFRGMTDVAEARLKLQQAHEVVDSLESLGCQKIALIHGVCLGGGLELALACDHRIALRGSRFGFPEVLLGLHPGLGGTFRSCELLGSKDALPLMLTGRTLSAESARRMGLVDVVTEERHGGAAVYAGIGVKRQSPKASGWLSSLLESGPARTMLASLMEKQTAKKVSRRHYPAPFELIDLWRQSGGDRKAMQAAEIDSFAALVTSAKGQNLVRVFFLREGLKRLGSSDKKDRIEHVHVVGAGAMGGDIAAWAAFSGLKATVSDRAEEMIAAAMARASGLADKKRLKGSARQSFFDRLIPDPNGLGLECADLIIEAVPEKLEIKRAVYAEAVARMKPDAILATNTSSIPLETLRAELPCADRFIGLHFFNPVARMQLVEVVEHDQVSESTRKRVTALVGDIDRLPVPVKSFPGFLVNRVLTPYLLEAMVMLDEGVSAETLDKAATAFGMPVGPIELADQVGLDVCLAVADTLKDSFDHPLPEVPAWVSKKIQDGKVGKKSGEGIYRWENGKAVKPGSAAEDFEQCVDRLLMPILNTSVECLRKGIVESEEILDGALIFGTGFAPFTGGPIQYARDRSVNQILSLLEKLAQQHGDRFTPDPGWQEIS